MLKAGNLLGERFRLLYPLGTGAHSRVWLAEDRQSGAPAALKFLQTPEVPAQQRRALLAHEHACLERVDHVAVARTLGVFDHDGEPYLALGAALGSAPRGPGAGTHPRSLTTLRGAPADDWMRPVLQLCAALQAVHDGGVVHRDLKAANVLIDQLGNALLIDFGVAALVGPGDDPARALTTGGSPLSMSPQQRAGEAPTAADDVYAFGVLLHELAFSRVPIEGAALPASHEGVPEGLRTLIEQCLASEPSQRPDSFSGIGRTLARIAAAELNATRAPIEISAIRATDFVSPVRLRAAGGGSHAISGSTPATPGRRGKAVPWRILGAVSAVGLLVLAGVVLSLLSPTVERPVLADSPPPPSPNRTTDDERSLQESAVAAPLAFARLRREREALLDDVNRVLDLQSALQAQAVDVWAGERYDEAVALANSGDELFRANDFTASAKAYADAEALFAALADEAPNAASLATAQGWSAYEAGQSAQAIAAFEGALAIDASLREARDGLARAQRLDEVLALSLQAQTLQRDGDLRQAANTYEQILALDAERDDARTALAQLRSRLDQSSFDQRMSEGFEALAAGDYARARGAFEAAGRLDPSATVVRDALAQVDVDARTQRLSELGTKAQRLAEEERWREALDVYDQALAIDATLRFAQEGREVAARMGELNEQLSFYADDPDRLTDRSILQRATKVLEQAQQASPRGSKLEERQSRLATAIAQVRQPVLVRLASDNRTSVRILRQADLGRFDETQIELRPGRYTIVGTRDGYRDVREELQVSVGAQSTSVDIRCTEAI